MAKKKAPAKKIATGGAKPAATKKAPAARKSAAATKAPAAARASEKKKKAPAAEKAPEKKKAPVAEKAQERKKAPVAEKAPEKKKAPVAEKAPEKKKAPAGEERAPDELKAPAVEEPSGEEKGPEVEEEAPEKKKAPEPKAPVVEKAAPAAAVKKEPRGGGRPDVPTRTPMHEGGRAEAPTRKPVHEEEAPVSRGQRIDLHASSESSVMVIASRSALGRAVEPWDSLVVDEGTLLPVELGVEAPINLRVVVGGALDPAEAEEWVGRVVTRLALPDGTLVVVGGTDLITEDREKTGIVDRGDVRVLDVAAGEYRAELLVYPTAPFGGELLARKGNEPLGVWWRRTRAGQPMPEWLRAKCREDPKKHDPGHEGEWVREREPRREPDLVEFLLHLTSRWGDEGPAPLEEGFVPADGFEARRPGRCPAGIAQVDPIGKPPRTAEDDEPAERHLAAPIHERVRDLPLKLVPGGAVRLPAERVARVARLAWFSHGESHPELRIEPGPGGTLPDWEPAPGLEATRDGDALRVSIELPGGGTPLAWELGDRGWLDLAGERVKAMPDGTVVELVASDPSGGVLRCRGPVRAGSWEIVSTYPSVRRDTLEGALALSGEVDAGETLSVEPDEADDLVDWAQGEAASLFEENRLSTSEGVVALKRRDPSLLGIAARRLFRFRFADAWPMDDDS